MREAEPAGQGEAAGPAPLPDAAWMQVLPPLSAEEAYQPTTARQRRGLRLLTVATVCLLWWLLLSHPGGDYRLYDPACPTGQERGCVGGLQDVDLIAAAAAGAASAASPAASADVQSPTTTPSRRGSAAPVQGRGTEP
jgi:hypothetical protein